MAMGRGAKEVSLNVLTLVERADGSWTARSRESRERLGVGSSERAARDDLLGKLDMRPEVRWAADRFVRTVRIKEHADGRWSASSGSGDKQIGWGSDPTEAEEDLVRAEYDHDDPLSSFEEYGYHRDQS